jgi:hypothetical protein
MIPFQYVWLVWASLFLIPWVALFIVFPARRKTMWHVSLDYPHFDRHRYSLIKLNGDSYGKGTIC